MHAKHFVPVMWCVKTSCPGNERLTSDLAVQVGAALGIEKANYAGFCAYRQVHTFAACFSIVRCHMMDTSLIHMNGQVCPA